MIFVHVSPYFLKRIDTMWTKMDKKWQTWKNMKLTYSHVVSGAVKYLPASLEGTSALLTK